VTLFEGAAAWEIILVIWFYGRCAAANKLVFGPRGGNPEEFFRFLCSSRWVRVALFLSSGWDVLQINCCSHPGAKLPLQLFLFI